MRPIVIWGAGGQGRELLDLCERLGRDVIGFLDDRPEMRGQVVDGVPVLGALEHDLNVSTVDVEIACAGVGDPTLKSSFRQRIGARGYNVPEPLIDPSVIISRRNTLAVGAVVFAGVTMTVNISVGECAIIGRSATIGHDTSVGDYATVAPGAVLSGNVIVGEGAFVGTNAAVREKISIGPWAAVGGGAFVTRHVPAHTLVVGVPAQVKKSLAS